VATVCDRVVVMYAGRVVEVAATEVLFAGALHPYTQALLRSVPRLDSDRATGGRLAAIGGSVPVPSALPPGCKFVPRCSYAIPECSLAEPGLLVAGEGHLVRCPVTIGATVA
jgi:oligopeptide/dipeptide ABC transporter ATP-binding protein